MRFKKVLSIVDCHAEGESGKVIVGGVGHVPGRTMFDKRVHLETHMDEIRKMVLFEPRGAVWHNANIVLPVQSPRSRHGLRDPRDDRVSGHVGIEHDVRSDSPPRDRHPADEGTRHGAHAESPAGLIRIRCECSDGKVTSVRLVNQPAFCYHLDSHIEVPGLGTVRLDIVYGGMTYAMVNAVDLGFSISPSEARELCEVGQKLKFAAAEQFAVEHPENPAIPGITNTEFMGPLRRENGQLISKNCVVVSPGRCDRSPCGTGSSARLALLHVNGLIRIGETFIHKSITGSRLTCTIDGLAKVGGAIP